MLSSFNSFIQKEALFSKADKILLCVSGGVDSVVMCDLFKKAGYDFGIAHCNFQLRGDESDEDELFTEELAESLGVEFHSVAFDTTAFAKKNKLSIQVAARELRYQWFEEIREQFEYDYVATAHHLDDSIETFFMNLARGTGVAGLHGILPKKNKLVRPLLFAKKEDVVLHSKKYKLEYREDSSNALEKYRRNKIRKQLIPLLKELNPKIQDVIANDIEHFRSAETIYKKEIDSARSRLMKSENSGWKIPIAELKKLNPAETYLYEFLSPLNYNSDQVKEIFASLDSLSGKQFLSKTHRLIKDRKELIIQLRTENGEKRAEQIEIKQKQTKLKLADSTLTFKTILKTAKSQLRTPDSIAQLDFDKLKFPLTVRKWKQGDKFQPLGMRGKKKLSDFFIDKKVSVTAKENTWLMISGNKIVWVVGMRVDEAFKVTEKTTKIYFVQQVFS